MADHEMQAPPIAIPDLLDTVTVARSPEGRRKEAPGYDTWADRGVPFVLTQAVARGTLRCDDEGNPLVRIRSVKPRQAITFHRKHQGSFSALDPYCRRSMSGVGPNELAKLKDLVTSHTTIEHAMQSLVFELPDGSLYTPDCHYLDSRLGIVISELKTSASYFYVDPVYRATIAIAEDASAAAGYTFDRETRACVRGSERRRKNVDYVYKHRFTDYSPDQENRVRAGLADGDLRVMGDLVPMLGPNLGAALGRAAAMLCNRVLGFELDGRLEADTPVFPVAMPRPFIDIHSIDVTVPVNRSLFAGLGAC